MQDISITRLKPVIKNRSQNINKIIIPTSLINNQIQSLMPISSTSVNTLPNILHVNESSDITPVNNLFILCESDDDILVTLKHPDKDCQFCILNISDGIVFIKDSAKCNIDNKSSFSIQKDESLSILFSLRKNQYYIY